MASSLIQVRVDENIKEEAEEIFNSLGLSMSEAVRLFVKRSVIEQGLPFSMNLNNEKTATTEQSIGDEKSQETKKNDFDPIAYIYSIGEEK